MRSMFPLSSPEEWKEKILKELKGEPFEKLISQTADGHDLLPFYTAKDRKGLQGMHAMEAWKCRQDFWGKKETELNALIFEALASSVSSIGLDDREGNDLGKLLQGIQADILALHIRTEEPARTMTDLKRALDKTKTPSSALRGGLDHDPIGEALERGFWKVSSEKDIEEALVRKGDWADEFGRISIRMDRFHMAGATSGKELLYGLASAKAYLDHGKASGMDLDSLAKGIRLQVAMDSNFVESVAKFMALRLLWANLMKAYNVKDLSCHLTARTSGWSMAPLDLDTNLLRNSSQAFSAITGGCDELMIAPHDGSCNAFSMRMSRNIQHILRQEAYLDKFANPAEGAYLFEEMTASLADTVWTALKLMDEGEGILTLIETGKIQADLKTAAEEKAKAILNGETAWLGVNLYASKEEQKLSDIHWTEAEETEFPALSFPIFHLS